MTKHGSASPRKQESRRLDANLKRRARKLATDSRVDPRTRSLIRYAPIKPDCFPILSGTG